MITNDAVFFETTSSSTGYSFGKVLNALNDLISGDNICSV